MRQGRFTAREAGSHAPQGRVRSPAHDNTCPCIPLVAGLFVVVEALGTSGVLDMLAESVSRLTEMHPQLGAPAAGVLTAIVANLVNNLPAGLVAGNIVQSIHASPALSGSILIGIDLGPNLSVTGSLATILWLTALRREGLYIGAWQFLKIGAVVATPAVILSLATLIIVGPLTSLP